MKEALMRAAKAQARKKLAKREGGRSTSSGKGPTAAKAKKQGQ